MRYACLVYVDEERLAFLTDEEETAIERACAAVREDLGRTACLEHAEILAPAATATSLRVHRGRISVSEGAAAAAGRQLRAIFIVEARDLNEALRLAARFPAARHGTIEVRPLKNGAGNAAARTG